MSSLATKPADALEHTRRIGRALADQGRLRILAALAGSELCVCHLVDLLDLDASTVSRHVSILRDAGLVETRKDGRWLHCRRATDQNPLFKFLDTSLRGAQEIEDDKKRLSDDCC
ncbi:MAG: metalloregulator ArsR/SmtB family transcription factor [Planctomycetota bacterium]